MRFLIAVLAIALVVAGSLALAVVFSGQGTLVINETITVDAVNLDVVVEPNLVVDKTITVNNTGQAATDVQAVLDVLDDFAFPYPGISVTVPQQVTVPPGGSAQVAFTVTGSNGVAPGTGLIQVSVIRP